MSLFYGSFIADVRTLYNKTVLFYLVLLQLCGQLKLCRIQIFCSQKLCPQALRYACAYITICADMTTSY